MQVRIGIDVGGTFTDAVAIDNETFNLIDSVKVKTTHKSLQGVAAGIIQALKLLMEKASIKPSDVVFIAHGTTQATNALLEGDVANVGIVTLGKGLEGMKSKSDSRIGPIELAPGKILDSSNAFVDLSSVPSLDVGIDDALATLVQKKAQSIVAVEAFSVDDPRDEEAVLNRCEVKDLPATATNEISKLYGLKVRTRTAVVNASIMPKMMETATMTEESIKKTGIGASLMVMRCDGGVMTINEVRHRPILTILSGPAAGVAGALMYERLTDGLFFEVGGTSTDISCVKNGKVMVAYAQVGGHKTYLNSLDVRTVGIGGGSMIEISGNKPIDVGPRSAHIAGIDYEVYSPPLDSPSLVGVHPLKDDPAYAVVQSEDGSRRALTLSGAANIAGMVSPQDYAFGDVEAARIAWKPLADAMGMSVENAARYVLDLSTKKNEKTALQLMKDYGMDSKSTVFVGGGGGAAAVVPFLATKLGYKHKMAKNASVISPIGVALAMVRDSVERTIVNPTQEDILELRNEVRRRAEKSGANPKSIEINVSIDAQRNLVTAVAIGTTEMRTKNRARESLSDTELAEIVSTNLDISPEEVKEIGLTGNLHVFMGNISVKRFFGLLTTRSRPLRVIDDEGVIRLQKSAGRVIQCTGETWKKSVSDVLETMTEYNDGGENLPNIYVLLGRRIVDLSGFQSAEQVLGLGEAELSTATGKDKIVVIGTPRTA